MARPGHVRAVLLGAVALALAALAGCSTVQAFSDLDAALDEAGFSDTQVNVAGGDPIVLTVSADSPAGASTEEAQDQAAEVVWDSFPRHFEQVRITVDGEGRSLTSDQLQERFGDRPAGLEEGDLTDDLNRVGIGFLIGILVAGLLVVATAGVVVLVVVRRRRRTPRPGAPQGPWAPPPGTVGPPAGPVAPPGGWVPASGWADPSAGTTGPVPAPSSPPEAPGPPPWSTEPHHPPPGTAPPQSRREARADARRRGRPFRGPRPPESQIPPGWD